MLVEFFIGILLIFNNGTGEIAQYVLVPTANEADCINAISRKISSIPVNIDAKVYAVCEMKQIDIEYFTIDNSVDTI